MHDFRWSRLASSTVHVPTNANAVSKLCAYASPRRACLHLEQSRDAPPVISSGDTTRWRGEVTNIRVIAEIDGSSEQLRSIILSDLLTAHQTGSLFLNILRSQRRYSMSSKLIEGGMSENLATPRSWTNGCGQVERPVTSQSISDVQSQQWPAERFASCIPRHQPLSTQVAYGI
jgi:hypothetical protein